MGFSLALIFVSAVIATSSGIVIPDPYIFCKPPEQPGESLCPPPEQVHPCTCSKVSGRVTVLCTNISNESVIRNVFSQNPEWKLQDIHLDQCAINYIPSSIFKRASFQTLNVTSSYLVSLFDEAPVNAPKLNVYLNDVKILRGIRWELFSNSSLCWLEAWNVDIKNFGDSFKRHMPPTVKYLRFENTKTVNITRQAFQQLVNVEVLALTGGSLKKISRDMFPKPWNIKYLYFSQQKLAALPKDFFKGFPKLTFFDAEDNFLTTISEDVFTRLLTFYLLQGNPIICNCEVKWICTSKKVSPLLLYGTCAEPESFKGRKLNSLTEADFSYCR